MTRVLLTSLAMLAMVASLRAAELILAWDFPQAFVPTPESFLVSYRSSTAPQVVQQFRIPNQGRASCDGAKSISDLTPDSVCGRPPACLPPAFYLFTVQAEVGEQRSPESAFAACEAKTGCTYDCAEVSLPPALRDLANAPGGTNLPPDPQQVAEVVATLARAEAPPVPPSVPAPPPTIQDIIDQVPGALSQRPRTPV
jgi:hypothetical protein